MIVKSIVKSFRSSNAIASEEKSLMIYLLSLRQTTALYSVNGCYLFSLRSKMFLRGFSNFMNISKEKSVSLKSGQFYIPNIKNVNL